MQDIRWQAPVRLGTRSQRLVAKGHQAHVVTVAMARALAGVVWAMAPAGPLTQERPTDHVCDGFFVRDTLSRFPHGHAKRRRPGVGAPAAA